jgi:hypothetical protein
MARTARMTLNSAGALFTDGSGLNNLNLENQSVVPFPPSSLGSSSAGYNTNTLGHGNYTVSSSSTHASSKDPFRAFDSSSTTEWSPLNALYTGTNNVYAGTVSTLVSDVLYQGEWIQLNYNKGFSLTSLAITGLVASNLKCPNNFIVAGSINGSNWTLLSSQVGITDYTTTPTKTFTIYNSTNYNFYRIIVTKTIGDTNVSIQNISMRGTQNSTYANVDTLNNFIYNTNEKQFLPSVYSSATPTTEIATTIQEVFNCIPTLAIKQILAINNQNYYIYSSTSTGITSNNKEFLFNPSNTNIVSWATSQYTNGVYSANTNYISDSTYKGDWIIIEFPFKLVLTKFAFTQTINTNRSPSKWELLGSFDGVTWNEITEGHNATGAVYTNSKTTTTLPLYYDTPYLYYGWVFSALVGTAASASALELQSMEIFGKDDIANAYSNVWIKSNSNIYNNLGNVGIGTTNPNNFRLNVAGNTNLSGDLSITGSLNQTNSTQSNVFMGKIGIGTTNPIYALDIRSGSVSFPTNTSHLSSDRINRFFYLSNGPVYLYGPPTSVQLFKFRTGSNDGDILTIYNNNNTVYVSSNIGIGITNPTQNFAVIGTSYFSSNVGIGTAIPTSLLTINNIPLHRSTFDHSTSPVTITHPTVTSDTVLNDPQPIIHLCRDGTVGKAFGSRASLKLSRYEDGGTTNSRTRLDLTLAHNQYDDVNIMTFHSSGNIAIGTTNPNNYRLNVAGSLNATSFSSNTLLIDFNSYATRTALTTASNTLQTNINAKQDLLTNSTVLSGIGSNLALINYATLSNLPTDLLTSNIASNIFLTKSGGILTSNLIINNSYIIAERQYPPKQFTSSTSETPITFLGQNAFSETITLDTTGITYGSGDYILYSSTNYTIYSKKGLFNYSSNSGEVGGHWSGTYSNGIYVDLNNKYIKSDYLGDWLIVKLPNPIILSRYRFYPRIGLNARLPGEFKFYGSMNGIDFTEITQASQMSRLDTNAYPLGYYEKTLTADFNTPYLYIGFTVNKLIGVVGTDPTTLNFQEFQIFGKEVVANTATLGIGITNPNAIFELYSTSQLQPEIILSGTDFSTGMTSSSGVAVLLGNNITNDRQLWIADSSNLAVGTVNPAIRIMPNTRTIDAVATNGTTPLSLGIGNTRSPLFLNGNNIYGDASQYNNFKFENNNQSNLIYPPIGISTSAVSFLTPALVQSQFGNYQISASSNTASAYLAFDKSLTTEYTNPQLPYRADGTYSNASPYITSNIVSGIVVVGEWLQLYYDKGFAANSITISGISASNLKCPKDFILAGSKDSLNWILLSSQVGIGTSAYAPSNIYSVYNYTSYNYYRLIVPKTIGAQTLSIADISLGGNTNTSFTPLDNYNILLYNTNEKQFPPKIWDVAPVAEILSSNELFNIAPASYYRQQFSLNNHGTYTLYSSSTWTGNLAQSKSDLFNYNINDGEAHWFPGSYTTETGLYNNAYTSTIGSNNPYKGDWIIVKFPFPILLTRYRFYQRSSFPYRSPGFWKCYGSNDGVNWTEITDASNSSTTSLIATYTTTDDSVNYYYQKVVLNLDIPYLYIGWVVNQLAGTHGSFANVMNFAEIQIYGKDDISNSYLNVWIKSNSNIYNTLGNVGIGTTNPTQRLTVVGNSYFSGNVGIGTTNPGSYLLNVAGSLNANSIYNNNSLIDFNSYATTTALAGKENTLTFSSPLTRTTNTISIDLSAYSTTSTNNTNYLRLAAATNDLTGKLAFSNNTNLLNTPQIADYGGVGDRIILWTGGGDYP